MIVEDYKITKEDIEKARSVFYGDLSDKPAIEQKLHRLQEDYLLNPTNETRSKFVSEIFDYMKPVLLKQIKNNQNLSKKSKLWIDPEDIDYIVSIAVDNFMKKYKKDQHYVVGASFFGVLKWSAIEAKSMYLHNKNIIAASLDKDLAQKSNKEYTVLDLLEAKKAVDGDGEDLSSKMIDTSLHAILDEALDDQFSEMSFKEARTYYNFLIRVAYYIIFIYNKKIVKNNKEMLVQIEKISNNLFNDNYKLKNFAESHILKLIKRIQTTLGVSLQTS